MKILGLFSLPGHGQVGGRERSDSVFPFRKVEPMACTGQDLPTPGGPDGQGRHSVASGDTEVFQSLPRSEALPVHQSPPVGRSFNDPSR